MSWQCCKASSLIVTAFVPLLHWPTNLAIPLYSCFYLAETINVVDRPVLLTACIAKFLWCRPQYSDIDIMQNARRLAGAHPGF